MKLIQKSLAIIFTISVTLLMTSPFTPQQADADSWSDCDGEGNPYLYGFYACVAANARAIDICMSYWDCKRDHPSEAWHDFWQKPYPCESDKSACDAAWEVASEMCRCDS